MVIVLVVLSATIIGSVFYWIKATNSYSSYAGLSEATFTVSIESDTKWSGTIGGSLTRSGTGSTSFTINSAMASAILQKQTDSGYLTVTILKDDTIVASQTTYDSFGIVAVTG
jgi:hypothetical protein